MDPAPVVTAPAKSKRQRKREQRSLAVAAPAQVSLRQSRVRISKLDLWSVARVSLCFYLGALAVLVAAGVVLWLIGNATGAIGNFEDFMGELLTSNDYRVQPVVLLEGSVLVGLVLVALLTTLTVVGAALYNLFSELVGGFEVTLVESEHKPS